MTGRGQAAAAVPPVEVPPQPPLAVPEPVFAPPLTVPQAVAAPEPLIPQVAFAPLPVVAAKAPRTCLIVDDSRVVRKISRGIVESLGYAVIEAENGEEALARCRATMPDLIVLDWDMPVMTGIEFIAGVRALAGGQHPKAMFCTSKSETLDIAKGIAAGANEYIVKPFDEPTFRTKLERIGAI